MKKMRRQLKLFTCIKINTVLILFFTFLCIAYFVVKTDDYLTYQTDLLDNTSVLPEILDTDEYVQLINCEREGLKQIRLLFSTFDRTNVSSLQISLCDEADYEIEKWIVDCSILRDNEYYSLAINHRIINSKGNNYYLHIKSDAKVRNGVTINCNDSGEYNGLQLNGKKLGKSLCYQLVYKSSLASLFSGGGLFHVCAVLLLALLSFLCVVLFNDVSIENKFIVMWILSGLMYLFSMTLFRAPDEEAHFKRVLELSYGYPLSVYSEERSAGGRELPLYGIELDETLEKDWQTFSDNKKKVKLSENFDFTNFTNTALYSPLSYIPQTIGVYFARHITKRISSIAYAGRIVNWMFISIILYMTIKLIPFAKEIVALIALMPMNIQESISLAPDGMVVALSLFLIAFILQAKYVKTDCFKWWNIVLLYIAVLLIGIMKIVYLPFGLLCILIPKERFKSEKRKWIHIVLMAVLAVGSNLVWMKLCSKFLVIGGTNASVQLSYLKQHIGYYIAVMARTVFSGGAVWANTMVGSTLAELNVATPGILVTIYLCLLAKKYTEFSGWSKNKEDLAWGCTCLITIGTIIMLIFMSLYLQWTPVYNNVINGIQGRYFIALLLPTFLVFNKPSSLNETDHFRDLSVIESGFLVCINVCASTALLFSCLRIK